MGQYYDVITKTKSGKLTHYDRRVDGNYTSAKLVEHSWIGCNFVDTLSNKLYNKPQQVAWVGDYSDDQEPINGLTQDEIVELHDLAHNEEKELKASGVKLNKLDYTGLYLVNHTKGLYINMDAYIEENKDSDGDTLHPLPLLTALGNGKGGGDYFGTNQKAIGSWAMDLVEFKDAAPKDYTEARYIFLSDYQHPRQEVKEKVDENARHYTGEHNGQYVLLQGFNYEERKDFAITAEWRGKEKPKLYNIGHVVVDGKVYRGTIWKITETPENITEGATIYHDTDYTSWVETAMDQLKAEAEQLEEIEIN